MATYTTRREERDPDKIRFTKTEAAAMLQAGFRFAEFSTENDRYRLLIPCRIAHNLDRGTLTIEQP